MSSCSTFGVGVELSAGGGNVCGGTTLTCNAGAGDGAEVEEAHEENLDMNEDIHTPERTTVASGELDPIVSLGFCLISCLISTGAGTLSLTFGTPG